MDKDFTKLNNSELLEAYKIIFDYIKELNEKIEKVDNDDWETNKRGWSI